MQDTYTTYSTSPSNNVLHPVFERSGIHPPQFAYQTVVNGRGLGAGPTIPGGYAGNASMISVSPIGGDGQSGAANLAVAEAAASDPFNPVVSPVVWAIVFLVVGLLGLRYVHWRG